jgi:hypothetical protein
MHEVELIAYYSPPGADVKAAAEAVRDRVPSIRKLAKQVEKDHKKALEAVAGDLESSMADAPTGVIKNTNEVMQAAEFAGGCLEYFSQSIDKHNYSKSDHPRAVAKLNAEYNQALQDGFGVDYKDPGPNATQKQKDKAHDTFLSDYGDARNAKIAALRKEAAQLDGWLDGEADDVKAMLDRGPNKSDIQALYSAGALAPYAVLVFPKFGLEKLILPPGAQQELLQYLIDHPDLLINPPAELAAVIAGLPTDIRTKVYVEQRMEHLRREGLLTGPNPGGYYESWIRNTVENGVSLDTVIEIAREHDIRPDDFNVLNGQKEIKDPDGKSFFLLNTDISGDDARKAVLMSYILNAGTDYTGGDYSPTPYGSDEVQRIIDRQDENDWSYDEDVGFVHSNGGRLVATPNGMMMGAGGNELQDLYSLKGGTTWGDTFMINEDDLEHPDQRLEEIIRSGQRPAGGLDLDRLLHHEERHSQQWARDGYLGFMWNYAWDSDGYEKDAGLSDGGY